MFSNRSVIGHPTSTPMEYAGTPDAFEVPASWMNWFQSLAGCTPASLYALTLYQTSDLLAAL